MRYTPYTFKDLSELIKCFSVSLSKLTTNAVEVYDTISRRRSNYRVASAEESLSLVNGKLVKIGHDILPRLLRSSENFVENPTDRQSYWAGIHSAVLDLEHEIFWLLQALEPDNLYRGGKGTLLLDDAYQKLCEACGHDRELYSTLEAMGLPKELPESEQTADKIRFIIPQIKNLEEILAEATEALSTYVRNSSGHGGKKDDSSIEGSSSSRTERHPGTGTTVQEALATSEWYVSYAWGDDRTPEGRAREEIVDHLCAAAMAQGHVIFRDKNVLNLGDRISNFMKRIGRGDRIFVILSDKYLRSPYCMFELSEIWRTSQQEGEAFLNRVRIYALPDAKIFQPEDWVDWSIYWKKEHDNLESRAQQHGIVVLGEQGHRRLTQMRNLYSQISDILGTVADIVQPRTFEDLERYGFSERTDEVGVRTQLR